MCRRLRGDHIDSEQGGRQYGSVLLAVEQAAGHAAPWWFSGTIGLVGVVVGLALKWLIDALATQSSRRREDDLRFVDDKRAAYADLLAACNAVADWAHDQRLHEARGKELDNRPSTGEEEDAYAAEIDSLSTRRSTAFAEVNRAAAIVDLIGPEKVVLAASLLLSRSHHPHLMPIRVEAESAFVDAAREDLGYPATSHLRSFAYEDFIPADHPESGVPPSGHAPSPTAD
jgi:hypothetical protein